VDLTEKATRSSDGELVHLIRTEWDLLAILVRNPGKLVSQRQLPQDVWVPPISTKPTPCASAWLSSGRSSKRTPPAPDTPHRARHGIPLHALTGLDPPGRRAQGVRVPRPRRRGARSRA
jgi:hypothetical protein